MDPYAQQELIEKVTDLIGEDNAVEAITVIAAAYEVDLYDLDVPEADDAPAA